MRLDRNRCEELLGRAGHGILGTVHARRGVDLVPVCFVVDGVLVAVPTDTVKPKSGRVLQRSRNLDADPRAVLLCDHWDPVDWTRLWWVRAVLEPSESDVVTRSRLESLLEGKYPQYRGRPFAELLVFTVTGTDGWSGEGP